MSTTFGIETDIEIGGKKFTLSRFSYEHQIEFLDWANKELGDPVENIAKIYKLFPEAHIQTALVNKAIEDAKIKRTMDSPEVWALQKTPQGSAKLMVMLLRKHHSELTPAQIDELVWRCNLEHGPEYFLTKLRRCFGQIPQTEEQVTDQFLQEKGLLKQDESFRSQTN